jgi:hypothetical protein
LNYYRSGRCNHQQLLLEPLADLARSARSSSLSAGAVCQYVMAAAPATDVVVKTKWRCTRTTSKWANLIADTVASAQFYCQRPR